jgi:hypothetical protein
MWDLVFFNYGTKPDLFNKEFESFGIL